MDKQHSLWLGGEGLGLLHWVVGFSVLLEPASRIHLKGQDDRMGTRAPLPFLPPETRLFALLPLPRFARVRVGSPAFPDCLPVSLFPRAPRAPRASHGPVPP